MQVGTADAAPERSDQHLTRAGGTGVGDVLDADVVSPWNTAAFMMGLPAWIEEDLALDLPGCESVELLCHGAGGWTPSSSSSANGVVARMSKAGARSSPQTCASVVCTVFSRITNDQTSISWRPAGNPTCRIVAARSGEADGDQLARCAAGLDDHVGARWPHRLGDLGGGVRAGRDAAGGAEPLRAFQPRAGKSTTVRSTSTSDRSPVSTKVPIAPARMSTTLSPSRAPERRAACRPTASGWARPAASRDSPAGIGTSVDSGTATNSAIPPAAFSPRV